MYHKLLFPTRTKWDMSISDLRHIEIICSACKVIGKAYA